jgi:hypothetical protein
MPERPLQLQEIPVAESAPVDVQPAKFAKLRKSPAINLKIDKFVCAARIHSQETKAFVLRSRE